ncbi:hypothetical protein DJ030_01355 [bacterium endosymbiont of Escarpia laminata]|nr:MAG: hypothetical protein DJ030_01355 [bacterium endosymbiont of Escarpia laminata]
MTLGDEMKRRYPRLIHTMQSVGLLTESEAIGALVEYGIFGIREDFGSEAVTHLGGQLAAIRHAIKCRHLVPRNR